MKDNQYTNKEFKKFLQKIKKDGAFITKIAEQDKEGNFTDYQYAIIEFGLCFWYVQVEYFSGISCTQYIKKSYDTKIQSSYPIMYNDFDGVYYHITKTPYKAYPLSGVYEQRINWIDKNKILSISGFREKEILKNISHVEMIQHDNQYKVIRFYDSSGNYFDYEANKKIITG